MSRFVVVLLVACLFVFVQGFPQGETTGSPAGSGDNSEASKIQAALRDAMDSLQKSLQNIMEDPQVNKFLQDGQKMVQEAATAIKNEAAKIVPKTDGK